MNETARVAALQDRAKEIFGPGFGQEHAKSTVVVTVDMGIPQDPATDPDTAEFNPAVLKETARGRKRLHDTRGSATEQRYLEEGWVKVLTADESECYICTRCWRVYNNDAGDGYETLVVYFHGIDKEALMTDRLFKDEPEAHCDSIYTGSPGVKENAWQCASGCFHHDEDPPPAMDVWMCSLCEDVFPSFWEAMLCWDSHQL